MALMLPFGLRKTEVPPALQGLALLTFPNSVELTKAAQSQLLKPC